MDSTETTYLVRVDYSQSLQGMIEAGKYEWVNPSVIENFSIERDERIEEVKLVLLHLNRWASTEEIENEIKKRELNVVNLRRLLAFGAKYPNLQKQFPISALDSVWVGSSGHHGVPYLYAYPYSKRYLGIYWCIFNWDKCWRFLVTPA